MIELQDGAYIDNDGVLVLEIAGKPDPFAQPDTPIPRVKFWTGFRFLNVPIWNWPLNKFYDNNPLQFAAPETAAKIAEIIKEKFGDEWGMNGWKYELAMEEVKVGPFMWRDKWMVHFTQGGRDAVLNAGLLASTYSRHTESFLDGVRREIAKEFSKRPQGEE